MNFFELLKRKNENIPGDFLIDGKDVDYYFFYNFLDAFCVQNRVIRLSRGLFGETYSIKIFTFEPSIECQSYKITTELYLIRIEIFLILEKLKMIGKLYDNILKTLFIP